MRIEFDYDAQIFEIVGIGALTNSQYLVLVDGKIAVPLTALPSAANYRINIDLGSAAPRRVSLILDRVLYFGGIYRQADATVSFPHDHSPIKFAVLGDSWALGTGADAQGFSYANTLGHLLGFPQTFVVSAGGTGMVSANTQSGEQNYVTRWPDVVATAPDVLVIQGSQNDASADAGTVQAAAATLIANAQRDLPNSVLLFVSLGYPRTPSASQLRVHTEVLAACATAGIPCLDTQNPALFYGTGTVSGPSGSGGNANRYCQADYSHPNQLGHDMFARNVATWVAQQLGIASS